MLALDICGLKKVYANGVVALDGIDLQVHEGDFFALLGPNGAGKSTAIGIITSLVRKSAGAVKVFGIDIDRDFSAAKAQLGVVPQEFNFSQFETVLEIIVNHAGYHGLTRNDARDRAEVYLRELFLWERRSESARNLSGGMKRRLMIARALVHKPRLLILDEPTAGVDIEVRRSMWDFLTSLNKAGTTIILTTHYLEEAELLCRNIAIIDAGKIVENTSMKRVLAKLHREIFIFDLAATSSLPPDNDSFTFRLLDDTTLEVSLDKRDSLNDLFSYLSQLNVQVVSMRNKSNRLEELFVRLTKERDFDG